MRPSQAARPLTHDDAVHLLRRLTFGARPADVARIEGRPRGEVVEELVAGARAARISDEVRLLLPAGEIGYLQAWWLERMLGPLEERLRERAVLMWHGHFATSFDKVRDVHLMYGQNRLFRSGGLGDFRELLHAATLDPAMLIWLDGVENERGRPNENHARELMELFALGIGNYSEDDVQEAARGLSGWVVRQRRARFVERRYDDGEKTVLGRTGPLDAEAVVDAVLAQPVCAVWIARRLWTSYCSGEPTADELESTARELVAADWDVGRTLTWLVTRDRFLSETERGARVAGPVEYVVRTSIELGVTLPPGTMVTAAAHMGQQLLRPPSVKGWDEGRAWIDSTGWIARMRFAHDLAQRCELPTADAAVRALLHLSEPPEWVREIDTLTEGRSKDAIAAVLSSAECQLQ